MTTPQDLIKRDLKVTNIDKYHLAGYTGKGYTIFNTEDGSTDASHMRMTNKVIVTVAPEATCINGRIGASVKNGIADVYAIINGEKLDLGLAIDKYRIDVVSSSLSGITSDAVLDYIRKLQVDKDVIFVCAAGNDGSAGVTGKYTKDDAAIAVAAVYVYEDGKVSRMHYSAIGKENDFSFPLFGGSGTSASCPGLAAAIVLLMHKYGRFNRKQCNELLTSISMDLGEPSRDDKYGHGMPVLPLTTDIVISQPQPVEQEEPDMGFKDIEDTRWSKEAIDYCVNEGILVGFEDNTFRPTETVTREQLAVVIQRLLNKK